MNKYLNFIAIFILLILSYSIKVHAILLDTTLTLKSSTNNIKVNEEFYISLESANIYNLYTLNFQIKFNPNIIEILSIEPGDSIKNENIEFNSNFIQINDCIKLINFFETFTGQSTGKTLRNTGELVKIKAKLLRECKIPLQIINTNNELFIGTPNIRTVLVDNILNKINFNTSTSYIQTSNFYSDDAIKLFIADVYQKTFSRAPEEYGFNYWYNKLISYEYSVRNFLLNMLNEKEFIDKNLSNSEFVTSMYSIIANREPDEVGYNYWLNMLMEYQNIMDSKEAKSQIILRICNEAELEERSNNLNLQF